MKYTLQVNQIAAHALGIQDVVDLIDLCLFDAFKSFANSAKCEKLIDEGGIWFWISYAEIIREIPMAGIKSKDGVYRRMLKLKEAGIIVFHPNNQKLTKTFFQWGPNYDGMERTDWQEIPTDEKPKVAKDLRMKHRTPTDETPNPPTDETPNNQSTIYQSTNQVSGTRAKNLKVELHDPKIPGVKIVEGFSLKKPVETADEAEAIILKWAEEEGRETVRNWYSNATRPCTVKDVKNMVQAFVHAYLTIGDEGKRIRMQTDPLQCFKYTFKVFLKGQPAFERKQEQKAQVNGNGTGSPAKYENPVIPVFTPK